MLLNFLMIIKILELKDERARPFLSCVTMQILNGASKRSVSMRIH